MPFAAALSTTAAAAQAVTEVCDRAGAVLGGRADLAVLFFSAQHLGAAQALADGVTQRLAPGMLLGCVAEGVIGEGREVEGTPALALWLARWSRPVQVRPFHLVLEQTADGPSLFGWPDELLGAGGDEAREPFAPARSAVLLLGDPYTFPTDLFLTRMNEDARGVPVLGGMASGISQAGECRLLQGGQVYDEGAVGVLLEGELGLRWIVSQGCRPIGRPLIVTKAQQNVIQELGGRPPLECLRELWPSLPARDQRLFQRGLHLGRVLNEYQGEFQRGDFLIRNVVGLERGSGALVINDHVRVGQTVQFQLRDAEAADEDLHALLQLDLHAHERRPGGALLFSCNGRGTRLFEQPDHDATAICQETGPIPLAGFFAMGELGPVGGQNFIHGFTASVALFEDD
jgi:small ligand-binding sensory domain FIST